MSRPRTGLRRVSLSQWIIVAMILGIIIGWIFPEADRSTGVGGHGRKAPRAGSEGVVVLGNAAELNRQDAKTPRAPRPPYSLKP